LFTVMDECHALYSENCELKGACAELKRDIRELENENKILKDEKIKLDMKNLVLHEDIGRVKETLRLKEEILVSDLTKLEEESLKLKQKAESLLVKNNKLHETLKQAETNQATNRRWHDSSQALNWLNSHHNRGRKGLGFVKKHIVYPCNRNILDYQKILCVIIVEKSGMLDTLVHLGKCLREKLWLCKTDLGKERGSFYVKRNGTQKNLGSQN